MQRKLLYYLCVGVLWSGLLHGMQLLLPAVYCTGIAAALDGYRNMRKCDRKIAEVHREHVNYAWDKTALFDSAIQQNFTASSERLQIERKAWKAVALYHLRWVGGCMLLHGVYLVYRYYRSHEDFDKHKS